MGLAFNILNPFDFRKKKQKTKDHIEASYLPKN